MARLTSPSGAVVEVREDKVGALLRIGFSQEKRKAAAKKPSTDEKSE